MSQLSQLLSAYNEVNDTYDSFHIQIPYSDSLSYEGFNISTPKTLETILLPKLLKTSHTYNNLF